MFKVVLQTPDLQEAQKFGDKPSAMNCAIDLLYRHGTQYANVAIESADGAVVFAHKDILKAFEALRP